MGKMSKREATATEVDKSAPAPTLPTHGAAELPSVVVESYNLEIEDDDGFVGDKANKRAFSDILDDLRERAAQQSATGDPLGDTKTSILGKSKLDALLKEGDADASELIQRAIDAFAQELARVIRRFQKLKSWRETEHIVIGGGFRASRVGELAIARAKSILQETTEVDLSAIANHPNEAGLIGTAHLLPPWMLTRYEAMLAVDIGGTNIRAGLVDFNLGKSKTPSRATVKSMDLWRHGDENSVKRDDAVDRLIKMLRLLLQDEKKPNRIAPVIGIGCPGIIRGNGSILRGAQNLPGNWENSNFNLPRSIREAIPQIGKHETLVIMHNDAVVQGLSEIPRMRRHAHWSILTIGTGLGNAHFTSRD